MKAGIIGLPSVGKTTIFNVLTQGKAAAGPGAGRKLEPNVGIVKVPDALLDFLSSKFNPEKTTYATVEFVDVQDSYGERARTWRERPCAPSIRSCMSCARFTMNRCRTPKARSIRSATSGIWITEHK